MTLNDPDDADGSPNHFQNFPEIASAVLIGGDLTVRYRVDSAVGNSAYPLTVELFLADSAASGEGRTLVHRHTYDTPQAFTNITFTPAATVNDGDPIVATATDASGNTSEFSAAATATANHPPVVVNPIPDRSGTYGSTFSYSFPTNTFSDPDAGDTLTYTASGLPPGITFDGPSRTFNGTPSANGTFSVTVTATDNGAPPLNTNDVFDIVVAKAPLIATADNKSRLPGQPNPPLTGTLTGVTNGDNITVTFTTTANEASPPGNYPITPVFSDPGTRLPNYTVTTNAGTLTVVDCSSLAITNATLPNAVAGAPYSVTLRATNGTAPYTFAVTSGTLPGNLTLAANGLLSGTATNVGSYPLTITATSDEGCTASSNYVLTVVCPTITVLPATLPNGTQNAAYSQSITATGGTAPRTFAVTSGTLPPGLTLSSAGLLSGTPTSGGNYSFTVTATDAAGCTGSRSYSMNICPAITISPATLPQGRVGSAYSQTLTASGGTAPYTFAVTGGALPSGLTLSGSGSLSGTPTAAGTNSFTLTATDAGNCSGSTNYSVTVTTTSFTATGPMNTNRSGHTATLLPNGKVLVAGPGTSAELYDPVTGRWTATGSMNTARANHTATLLRNGKVLVARGGSNSAELYDPATGIWTATSSLNNGFNPDSTATLLPNGKVLLAGGYNSPTSAELYDPATGTWTVTGGLTIPRRLHTATLLPNGTVLVAGGSVSGVSLASAELYDPVAGTWAVTSALTTARGDHTGTLLPNGKVLVAGGRGLSGSILSSAELYDSAIGTWTTTGPLTTARKHHTATLLPNGKVLVAGGHNFTPNGGALASVELYDAGSGTWTATGPLNTGRHSSHTATLLPNGKVLVAGGSGNSFPYLCRDSMKMSLYELAKNVPI